MPLAALVTWARASHARSSLDPHLLGHRPDGELPWPLTEPTTQTAVERVLRQAARSHLIVDIVPSGVPVPSRSRVARGLAEAGLFLDAYQAVTTLTPLGVALPCPRVVASRARARVRRVHARTAALDAAMRRAFATRGSARVGVMGGSMAPTHRFGEVVEVEPCTAPRAGDVVLLCGPEIFLLHRVVRIVGGADGIVIHRGDAPGARSAAAAAWRVVGRVRGPSPADPMNVDLEIES